MKASKRKVPLYRLYDDVIFYRHRDTCSLPRRGTVKKVEVNHSGDIIYSDGNLDYREDETFNNKRHVRKTIEQLVLLVTNSRSSEDRKYSILGGLDEARRCLDTM